MLNVQLSRPESMTGKWIDDWGGDPDVIGGTFDCSRWECQLCGLEDLKRPAPSDHD